MSKQPPEAGTIQRYFYELYNREEKERQKVAGKRKQKTKGAFSKSNIKAKA